MASIKISALPLKRTLSENDIFTLVDTQRGAANYVSKRTTLGDIARFVQGLGGSGQYVLSVNGQTGAITLYLRTLTDTAIAELADKDVLLYNENAESCGCCRWENSGIIDSGIIALTGVMTFKAAPAALTAVDNAPIMAVVIPPDAVYSVNGKTGVVRLGVADMADTSVRTDPAVKSGDTLIYFEDTAKWTSTGFIDGGVVVNTLSITTADVVTSVNGAEGTVIVGIADLADVTLNGTVEKDILAYDAIAERWKNSPVVDGDVVIISSLRAETDEPLLTENSLELLP